MNKYLEAFGKPFDAADVSWRLQYVNKEKLEGYAVPYLDARAISDRLDEVVGQFRWKDTYRSWHSCVMDKKEKASQLCTISIYDEELKEWIEKTDGAEDSDVEPIKGGLSDAFKRAAVKWNIGRYLYQFEPVWVKAKPRGSGYVVEPTEQNKLNEEYYKKVNEIFGTAPGHLAENQKPDPSNTAIQDKLDGPIYEIKKVNVQQGTNGDNSLIIFECQDKQYHAYVRGVDERLKTGARIKNLKVEQKTNTYGKYNILNGYEMAA